MTRLLTLGFALLALYGFSENYNPYVDGARAAIRIVVCDERGKPVPNAHLIIGFQQSPERGKTVMGTTDAKGTFCCEEKTTSIVNVWAEKDGYYKTHVRKSVAVRAKKEVIGSRRWSQEPVAIPFVLKAMRNPLKLTCHSVDFKPFPDTNVVVKLDLETLAWCPPYGNGQHDDLHLVFDGWRNPNDWDDFHEHLKIEMPNGADGFYVAKTEPTSAFKYAYAADTNATYRKSFAFRHVHKAEGITESKRLAADEYLIYRVRTQTNELGQVTRAHYGRIGEKFSQYIGLSIKSWFNPNENDTNLEDARPCVW